MWLERGNCLFLERWRLCFFIVSRVWILYFASVDACKNDDRCAGKFGSEKLSFDRVRVSVNKFSTCVCLLKFRCDTFENSQIKLSFRQWWCLSWVYYRRNGLHTETHRETFGNSLFSIGIGWVAQSVQTFTGNFIGTLRFPDPRLSLTVGFH